MTIAAALARQAKTASFVPSFIKKDYVGEGRWDAEMPKEAKLLRFIGTEKLEHMSEDGAKGPVQQKIAAVCVARTMADADAMAEAVEEYFDFEPFVLDGFRYLPVSQGPDPDYNLDGEGDGVSAAVIFNVVRRAAA